MRRAASALAELVSCTFLGRNFHNHTLEILIFLFSFYFFAFVVAVAVDFVFVVGPIKQRSDGDDATDDA